MSPRRTGELLKVKATAWGRDARGPRSASGPAAETTAPADDGGRLPGGQPGPRPFRPGDGEGVEEIVAGRHRETFGGGAAGRTVPLEKGKGSKP